MADKAVTHATAQVGWIYDEATGTLEPPKKRVTHISRRQGRLALLEIGKLEIVEDLITQAGKEAEIEYQADSWNLDNPFLQGLWFALGGSMVELEALFLTASTKV